VWKVSGDKLAWVTSMYLASPGVDAGCGVVGWDADKRGIRGEIICRLLAEISKGSWIFSKTLLIVVICAQASINYL